MRGWIGRGLVAVLVLGSVVVLAGSSGASDVPLIKSVGVQLPVEDFRGMELDEARGRLYIAQGVGGGVPLVVTDLDGRLQTRLDAVTDVSDVVLSDDGRTLYAAQGFAQIAAVDTATLTVRAVYPAPDGTCVYTVEPSGDKVVGGFRDCGIGYGGLLVWSAPSAPVVYTEGPNYKPVIDASPGAPGLVVAGDDGISPVTTYVIDVSGDTPRILSRRGDTGGNLEDYAFSPDGTEVVQSVGSPYEHRAYRLPDLTDASVYPSGAYPTDAAWSADGSVVAVGRAATGAYDADVLFYPKGGTSPTYALDLRSIDELWSGTLLVNRDGTRAWAVSYDDVYQERHLLHSFGPGHPPRPPVTDLAVTARTGTGKDKKTAVLTVAWSSPISTQMEGHYWWITASTDGGPEVEFWRGPMNASGTYTKTYVLPRGTTTFTVRYKDFYDWYPAGFDTATLTR
jgi:WD40 repeat protein